MKLLVISLCTQGIGVMKEHFIYYCRQFAKKTDLYCITNDNVSNDDLHAIETLNIRYVHNDPLGYFDKKKIHKMKCFIDKVKPDVIFVLTHHTSSIFLPPILKGYNVVYQVHDPNPHLGTSILEKVIIKTQLRQFSKFAKKLIVTAETIKEETLKVVNFSKKDIEVIPLAVLDNYIDDSVKESSEDIDLLFYGKIKKYKGLDTFIKALDILGKKCIKPKVKIVGGTEIRDVYPDIKYIPDNVSIEGYADDKLLISYIKKAKALVLPYHEASGTMAIGQAFYYGTPVIATDVGCFPEYVKDGGLICKHSNPKDLADIIEKYLSDTDLQKELSINARKVYEEQFTLDDVIDKHMKVFEKIYSDRYYEHVETIDEKATHCCDEKLTEHNGHGLSKSKNILYIVMPAYNEQETIEDVVRNWYTILNFAAPESKLVVADSGSTDKTHEILTKLKLELPKLYILENTIKYHGGKLLALYKYAIKQRAEYIFQTDSDGQTNPCEFIEFWNDRNRYDAIIGNRVIRGDGTSRKFVENIVCLLLKLIFDISVPDANAPFRLMRTSLVNKYIDRFEDDYNIPNIMLTTFFKYYNEKINFKVITFKPRQGGINSINIVKIIKIGIKALKDFVEFRKGM